MSDARLLRSCSALGDRLADPYPTARIAAAQALGRLKEPGAAAALIGALSDVNLSVKVAVLKALRDIDSPKARAALARYDEDSDLRLRRAANGR